MMSKWLQKPRERERKQPSRALKTWAAAPDSKLEDLERVYCATPLSLLQEVRVDRGTGADERLASL